MDKNCNLRHQSTVYRTYNRRFVLLAIEVVMLFMYAFGNYQYSTIANSMTEYYNVSYVSINFTAILVAITTNVLFYPIGRMADIFGTKLTLVFGAGLLAFSAALKTIAVRRTFYWLLVVGQTLQSITFLVPIATLPVVGSHWFPVNEMALLTGGVLAAQSLGNCASFLLPSPVFKDVRTIEDIYERLSFVNITETVLSTTLLFVSVLFVKNKPPTPVSAAGVTYERTCDQNASLLLILRNRNLILLLVYHAILYSLYMAFLITLNQSVNDVFERESAATVETICGVLLCLSGMPAAIIMGAVTKKYPKYRLMLHTFDVALLVTFGLYIFALWIKNKPLLYTSLFFFGFANFGIFTFSLDFVLEVSYPYPAGILYSLDTSTGILPTFAITPLASLIIEKYGGFWANMFPMALIIISCIIALPVTEDLRRRRADRETQPLIDNIESLTLVP